MDYGLNLGCFITEFGLIRRPYMARVLSKNYSNDAIQFAFMEQKEKLSIDVVPKSLGRENFYGDKVFFAFVLITTIGYGNAAPKYALGQIACIIYTIFGIPLHVIMMRLLSFKFRGALRKCFTLAQRINPKSALMLAIFGTIFFLVLMIVFLFVPAYVFTQIESWTYGRGLYFSFVSLTTIGLGDFVASITPDNAALYYALDITMMLIWMFFGLAFVAMALNMFSYVMGVCMMDIVDSKCRKRASAKRRMLKLHDLVKELNWQLVKYIPENFTEWEEIEEFKNILAERPHEVTNEMLGKMLRTFIELKERAYEQISDLQGMGIPLTPIIKQARDNLPDILSESSTTVTYSSITPLDSKIADDNQKGSNYGTSSTSGTPKDSKSVGTVRKGIANNLERPSTRLTRSFSQRSRPKKETSTTDDTSKEQDQEPASTANENIHSREEHGSPTASDKDDGSDKRPESTERMQRSSTAESTDEDTGNDSGSTEQEQKDSSNQDEKK